MNKKLNKKLLNLIALCSGIIATVAVGMGGIVYSIQEKNSGGGDEPVDQKTLPESVYDIDESTNVLKGFKDEFLNDPGSEIYKDNFQDCDTMQIPANVTSINDNAFFDIPQSGDPSSTIPSFITKLTFAEGSHCSSIGEAGFCFFLSLTSVDFPSSLRSIGYGAFHGCSALTSVNLLNCTNLTKLNAFSSCKALTSVVLPNGLTEIGEYAFDSCSKLTSINFPSSLRSIDNEAFYSCSSLTSVNLSECIN